jgi:oxygen-independent coproporphyrinogen-3 oxidase
MLNGLRLKGGFSLAQFETRTGLARDVIFESLSGPIAQELVIVDQDKLKCSEKGYLFVDEILQLLLP